MRSSGTPITDEDTTYVVELRNGVLHHRTVGEAPIGVTRFTLARRTLIGVVTGQVDLATALGDGTVFAGTETLTFVLVCSVVILLLLLLSAALIGRLCGTGVTTTGAA